MEPEQSSTVSLHELIMATEEWLTRLRETEAEVLQDAETLKQEREYTLPPAVLKIELSSLSEALGFLRAGGSALWLRHKFYCFAYWLRPWIVSGYEASRERPLAVVAILCVYGAALSAFAVLPKWWLRLSGMFLVQLPILMLIRGALDLYCVEESSQEDLRKEFIDTHARLILEDVRWTIRQVEQVRETIEKTPNNATQEELKTIRRDLTIISILKSPVDRLRGVIDATRQHQQQLQERLDWESRLVRLVKRADARNRYRQIILYWEAYPEKSEGQVADQFIVDIKTVQRAMDIRDGKPIK